MKNIVFDVMGNDNGVQPAIFSALKFVDKNLDYIVTLVGEASEIGKYTMETERIRIIDAKEVDYKKPVRTLIKENNSMAVALKILKEGKADAILSSGNSGLYLSMATLLIKRIEGVKRPAFMPVMPTIVNDSKFLLLDVGANLITTSEMLVQWGRIGSIFAKFHLKIEKPRVGIINIGTEKDKGHEFQHEAYEKLEKDKSINFIGYVEPRYLLKGIVDVAVVDGYAGNLILKSMEGTVLSILSLIKTNLKSKLKYKIGALISKGAFKNVQKQLDYRNVGAAWVLGLNSLVIKTHGSSDEKSYIGAFNQIVMAIENGVLDGIKKGLNE